MLQAGLHVTHYTVGGRVSFVLVDDEYGRRGRLDVVGLSAQNEDGALNEPEGLQGATLPVDVEAALVSYREAIVERCGVTN
jgi:hypothetical protein